MRLAEGRRSAPVGRHTMVDREIRFRVRCDGTRAGRWTLETNFAGVPDGSNLSRQGGVRAGRTVYHQWTMYIDLELSSRTNQRKC